jgi:hypothetical protein
VYFADELSETRSQRCGASVHADCLATNCTPSAASTFKTVPSAGSILPLSDR